MFPANLTRDYSGNLDPDVGFEEFEDVDLNSDVIIDPRADRPIPEVSSGYTTPGLVLVGGENVDIREKSPEERKRRVSIWDSNIEPQFEKSLEIQDKINALFSNVKESALSRISNHEIVLGKRFFRSKKSDSKYYFYTIEKKEGLLSKVVQFFQKLFYGDHLDKELSSVVKDILHRSWFLIRSVNNKENYNRHAQSEGYIPELETKKEIYSQLLSMKPSNADKEVFLAKVISIADKTLDHIKSFS